MCVHGRGARKPLTIGGPSMSEKVPILVALGIGIDGKPHASRFADSDAPLVARAAVPYLDEPWYC